MAAESTPATPKTPDVSDRPRPPDEVELLTIGRMARLSGLSIKALRHYDRLGLLPPHDTDPVTGYRRYGADQLEDAALIRRLRELDMPLPTVRAVLAAATREERLRELEEYRASVQARAWRLQRVLHELDHDISRDGGRERFMPDTVGPTYDPEERRQIGVALFNRTWQYLEMTDRTQEQDDYMVHMAHASRFHWEESGLGKAENNARGEWQVSRVYSVVGRGEPAVYHALRCLEICEANGIGDFDIAYAYEALARAHAVAGNEDEARRFAGLASGARDGIEEDDDRELFDSDLATLPIR
jgi:DNA-binding transcriptional MerR regulator